MILIKHKTSPTRVSSVAGSILIMLNASPLETFELSLSGPSVLIQCNFTVFAQEESVASTLSSHLISFQYPQTI